MKAGMTMENLAAEIMRQKENKADYIRAEVTKLCEKYPLYK